MPRNPEGSPPPEQKISLDQWIDRELPQRYAAEVNLLRQTGLIEILPKSRDMGLLDINGRERVLPTPKAIAAELREHKEIYEVKLNQGFKEMEFTPFGSPLAKLEAVVRKLLLKQHAEGKLFGTDYTGSGEGKETKLDLDISQPLFTWDKLTKADETGAMVYDVKQFTKNDHGGKTKTELLEQEAVFSGWHVSLVEDVAGIPRKGKGRMVGNRRQIEAGISPNDYLKMLLTNPAYAHESGQTPEDELTRLIRSLLKNGHVIHDYQNDVDSLNYLIDSWVPASGNVPYGFWVRDYRQAYRNGGDPTNLDGRYGVAPAVRMGKLKV